VYVRKQFLPKSCFHKYFGLPIKDWISLFAMPDHRQCEKLILLPSLVSREILLSYPFSTLIIPWSYGVRWSNYWREADCPVFVPQQIGVLKHLWHPLAITHAGTEA